MQSIFESHHAYTPEMETIAPLVIEIDNLLKTKKNVIVAIDGRCAAGKSTAAKWLKDIYGCSIIHMDDFYLTPPLRTPERLLEIGGNVDYMRFILEVLEPMKLGSPFVYHAYHCKTGTFTASAPIQPEGLVIVEGAYSHHPKFNDPYDLKVFMHIDPKQQLQRIQERNGDEGLRRFINNWIPMEERYLKGYAIAENADLILHAAP